MRLPAIVKLYHQIAYFVNLLFETECLRRTEENTRSDGGKRIARWFRACRKLVASGRPDYTRSILCCTAGCKAMKRRSR
jgi:hypothetical protein